MNLESVLENGRKTIENLDDTINEQLERVDRFFDSKLGQVVNSAIDYGIRELLPNVIENEVIKVKDSLIEGGIQEGISKAIEVTFDKGRELLGIDKNTYESMEDIKEIMKVGDIKEGISKAIDVSLDNAKNWGILSEKISNLIKNGKNIILDTTDKNIEIELNKQEEILNDLDGYCSKWDNALEKGYSFNTLTKHYKNVVNELQEVAPLQQTIQKANEIKNQYELLKSKNEAEEELVLTDEERELCKRFA